MLQLEVPQQMLKFFISLPSVIRSFKIFSVLVLFAMTLAFSPSHAQVQVIMSGGFAAAYKQVLPLFESSTNIKVATASGASQGKGSQTIAALLANGAPADVVIMSREGLSELIAAGQIVPGSDTDLASVPLGAAVRTGSAKPDLGSLETLKKSLIQAQTIAVPGSTSGIFLTEQVFPQLGVQKQISVITKERGSQSAALVAQGGANMAIQPVSELVGVNGIDYVGPLPKEVQLVQVFAAAITQRAKNPVAAKQLIQFLASSRTNDARVRNGMYLP